MTKKVAIVQSSYIPWKGYFDLIASVDEFILFDDMQYTRRDWRNRNQVKTPSGLQWLTVPVLAKGKYHQRIRDTEIVAGDWAVKHWTSLALNYRRSAHFEEISCWLKPLYLERDHRNLSSMNSQFIDAINRYLGIDTVITNSWDYDVKEGKTERLASLCEQAGGTEYVSGPSAKDYIATEVFDRHGIQLTWFDYHGYPEYPQLWGEFCHHVSILDLLFNCGKEAYRYMRHIH
jgi:hypothetical protein